jgi:hypothetical protein
MDADRLTSVLYLAFALWGEGEGPLTISEIGEHIASLLRGPDDPHFDQRAPAFAEEYLMAAGHDGDAVRDILADITGKPARKADSPWPAHIEVHVEGSLMWLDFVEEHGWTAIYTDPDGFRVVVERREEHEPDDTPAFRFVDFDDEEGV